MGATKQKPASLHRRLDGIMGGVIHPFPARASTMLRLSTIMVLAAGFVAVGLVLVTRLAAIGWFAMPEPTQQSSGEEQELLQPRPREEFAADRLQAGLKVSPAPFDGERAIQYLKDVCSIGPRISGSDGMKKQQELLQKHFEKHGGKVELQRFQATQKSKKEPVEMVNLIASWWPDRPRRVIFCSHYDTRPIADQEPDMRKWKDEFLSANDGGSGVAFLMEMAHHIGDLKIQVGVDFVLFDGEEYIFDPRPDGDRYFIGSEYFAGQYKQRRGKTQYTAAILLDMIAGRGAKFTKDPASVFYAGALVESVWKTAAEQQCKLFLAKQGDTWVEDDHVPLNKAGIPAIDIIDFTYPHWHRLSDTPANCAPEPMVEVSKVLSVWLQRMK
jgi:hypothetical protein